MKTRVEVKRAELIRVVAGRVRKLEKEHERAVATYPDRLAAWQAQAVATLEKATEKARQGKPFGDRYGRVLVPVMPVKPNGASGELCNLRRVLKTLEIGAKDTILLSQEDANVYFGPCRTS